MINYIVIDDEKNSRELLIYAINSLDLPFNLVAEGKNLTEGVELIKKLKPHVVFLDIQMPIHNGLKIRDFLTEEETDFKLVFVTAYDQYAIQAIRLSAFDYLMKPIDIIELEDCVRRIINNNDKEDVYKQLQSIEDNNVLVIKSHGGTHFISINEIESISADGMYSEFSLVNKNVLSSKPLKIYENIHSKLYRCHRSYIVNLNFIDKIDGQNVVLKSGKEIPLSRQNRGNLMELLKS